MGLGEIDPVKPDPIASFTCNGFNFAEMGYD
jgi:hypothetical protein